MTEWRPVGRKATRAQVVGDIPDVHVITVRERRVTVDYPTIIQNNVNTDTIELDLDGEWDGMSVVLLLGECPDATELAWHGEPITLPSALAERTGGIDVSVVGYSADGETRLVTVDAQSVLNVVKSGCTVGEAPAEETPDLIGQLVAAGDAANKAAQAANTAATAANGAAGKANTAASAANTAAGKADTAATKATDAATEATEAAGDATRAAQSANAAAEAASAAAEAARGNVLTGTATGYVAHAEDAYAQKPIELRIKGRTVKNLWVNPNGTSNGLTVTANEDGSITLSGTPTSSNQISISTHALKPGSTYTVSKDVETTGVKFLIQSYDSGGSLLRNEVAGSGWGNVKTFTLHDDAAYVDFGVSAAVGQAASGTYRVMLNEGSEAQPWCPPGLNSVQTGNLVTAGKNLLQRLGPALPYTYNGITFSDNGDSGIKISGTSTASTYFNFFNTITRKATYITSGEYTVSLVGQDSSINLNVGYFDHEVGGDYAPWLASNSPGVPSTGSIDRPVYLRSFISVVSGRTVNTVVYPQLELGSTATTFEPPNITTTPPPEVELRSLPDGTCDELVIKADGTCEVERRTQLSDGEVTALPEPATEQLGTVTLPKLPAPTFNVYHDGDVPSDTAVTYERDVNIVIDNLAKQIAGTAATVAINEATR